MPIYLQGLTMGLAYVAPIGMQNLFVINAALTSPRRRALLTALIVIFFDVTLALACFFGVGTLMTKWEFLQRAVLLVGGLIVVAIGVGLIRAKPDELGEAQQELSIRKTISSACVVTWFNPQALIDGTMMLSAFHVTLPGASGLPFISGVASASCQWFLGLSLLISLLQGRFSPKILRGINVVCGAVILFYGLKLLYHFTQFFC